MISENLKQSINWTATYLAEGSRWHSRVANMLRAMPNKRGYARIHDDQAKMDADKLVDLNKMFRDFAGYDPVIDTPHVLKAESYSIMDFEDFKRHFDVWLSREETFSKNTFTAIELARKESITLYGQFCEILKDLELEYFRARLIKDALVDADWHKHHCAIVSKWLHEQAEADPKSLNYNIG